MYLPPQSGRNRHNTVSSGYTLVEVVIALAVLTIVTGVMVHSFLEVMRARRRVAAQHEARFVASRLAARVWLKESPIEVADKEHGGWKIDYSPEEVTSGKTNIVWHSWRITPSNVPMRETVLHLRADNP